ncbi:MAG: hypothetical protein JWO09_3287 [Bacteroidetes bacterium]|nr:hypothetical protein [Bacteroidota bacterium]
MLPSGLKQLHDQAILEENIEELDLITVAEKLLRVHGAIASGDSAIEIPVIK